MADVDVAVGIRRAVVQHELRPAFALRADLLIKAHLVPALQKLGLQFGQAGAHRKFGLRARNSVLPQSRPLVLRFAGHALGAGFARLARFAATLRALFGPSLRHRVVFRGRSYPGVLAIPGGSKGGRLPWQVPHATGAFSSCHQAASSGARKSVNRSRGYMAPGMTDREARGSRLRQHRPHLGDIAVHLRDQIFGRVRTCGRRG